MPTFVIEQLQIYIVKLTVEAVDEAEAIIKLFDGEATLVENSAELVEACDDRGLLAEDYPEVAEALRAAGIMADEKVLPSIRSIEQVG